MPAPFVMPSASGIDTNSVISKLIEVERIPLKRLEEDNKRNEIRIQAWEELRNKTKKLSDISRDIYSFTGPFANRFIYSSDDAITGTVSPNVDKIQQKIQVLELAKFHKIHSREIDKKEVFPGGKFTILINDKEWEIEFKEGNIFTLEKLLKEKASEVIDTSIIQLDQDKVILTLTSKISGKKGKIQFKDPDNILKKLEVIGTNEKKEEKEEFILFSRENFINNEKISIENDKEFSFSEIDHISYKFPIDNKITKIYFKLQFDILNTQIQPEEKIDNKSSAEKNSSTENVNVRKNLNSENEKEKSNNRQKEVKNSYIGKIYIHYLVNGLPETKEIILKQDQTEYSIDFKELENEEPKTQIKNIEFVKEYPGQFLVKEMKVKKIIDTEIIYDPIKVIEQPSDAKLLVNGVEIFRSSNSNITDIIPGVSLNLHKTTNTEVELTVKFDTQKIKDKIKEWVNAYNDLLLFIKENDKFNREKTFEIQRSTNPDERIEDGFRKLEDNSGIFAGDPVVRRLVSLLPSITGSSYPTKLKPSFKTLVEIGISTGKPGSNWQDIKQGVLQIDESKLQEVLENAPESVKELFALDKNEDAVIDDGIGYKLYNELQPYIKTAGGIITSRIDLLKEQIKENKKIIYNKELSLGRKEEMLRKKFGNMESTIQNIKSTQKMLQNKLGIKED